MAPWPRLLEQLAVTYLSGFLAQRMSRSPAILRAADRIRHEMDHLPHRLEGKPVPKYIVRDFDPPETTWIDHGEPHDEPSPFPLSGKYSGSDASFHRQSPGAPSETQDPLVHERIESEQRAMEFRELQEQLRRMK
ncbi:hypothetical protein MVES1_003941 [Malassezia vespertilionis]|uniref:uncharacterized protein n=1 Tax=Malassezia vespertilionis TaxID=2020962 RepID=UPI0024B1D2C7|nr:uncharacterized protein MVES1_003941 [Malassezia vespertilionis]WFD08565.1 hypothetical protein MVES1_003941 [Malassezia vespertilionis]